ncbi:hypothetical protein DB30_06409 [Enhygromyxa salina]|uniref:Uncharacterized protein n=1 Tax=Enhygromyxa salina TaxID=215803 RepID=A0A0C1ZUF3_9BACT|nr:hypothetical protein DB30_06409 [Enhygromyxa salina]
MPARADACKPPQFVAERLEFELVGARWNGQPTSTDGVPASVNVSSTPHEMMLIPDLGYLRLQTATKQLPASTRRYIRRKRRSAKLICAVLVHREPAIPGRFVPSTVTVDSSPRRSAWASLWPDDTPGVVELGPTREQLSLRIERSDGVLELEYQLTHASFSSCSVTGGEHPTGALGLLIGGFALGLTRRRKRA